MTSLSSILNDFSKLMEQIEENGGEIDEKMLPVLTTFELQMAQKIDRYVNFVDAVHAQADRTKRVIESMKSRLKTLETLETRLKDNVKHNMQIHNLLELQGEERTVRLVNCGGAAAIEKPQDMFYSLECVDFKYFDELREHLETRTVYVIRDKEKFKEAIRKNRITHCYELPRGKYVKFV